MENKSIRFKLTDYPEVAGHDWPEFMKALDAWKNETIPGDKLDKVDWQEFDGDTLVGEGGICLDASCHCQGVWRSW